jgi:hypothetical protein
VAMPRRDFPSYKKKKKINEKNDSMVGINQGELCSNGLLDY